MAKIKALMSDKEVLGTLLGAVSASIDSSTFGTWVATRLNTVGPYPWHCKPTMQEKVNSLLRHELACLPYDTYHLRKYLEDSDPVEVWARSINTHVVGHIVFE